MKQRQFVRFLRGFKRLLSVELYSEQFGELVGVKDALLSSASSSLRVLDLHTLDLQEAVNPLAAFDGSEASPSTI